MKKANTLFNYSCLILIILMGSCSQVRYSYLNKTLREKQSIDKQFVIDELKKQENRKIVSPSNDIKASPAALVDPCINTEGEIFSSNANLNKAEKSIEKNTKKSISASILKRALASKIISKLPNKLKASFAENKNIASRQNNQRGNNSLLYIIIVVILILVLLNLLGGLSSGIGGLLWLIITVLVILLLLRLLGLI